MRFRKLKYNALRVPCPRCGVYDWRPCVRNDGTERKAFHAERHTKAKVERLAALVQPKTAKRMPNHYNKAWAKKRALVFATKGNKCEYCGSDASHVDHQTPRARGGSDDITNLVPCCVSCNISKGMMTLEEWRG